MLRFRDPENHALDEKDPNLDLTAKFTDYDILFRSQALRKVFRNFKVSKLSTPYFKAV